MSRRLKKTVVTKVKRRILKTRHKEQSLLLDGWINTNGWGAGLIAAPVGSLPRQNGLKTEVIDYTYDGNRRTFNVCHQTKSYLGVGGLFNPRTVTRWKNTTIGWTPNSPDIWNLVPPTVLGKPDMEVVYASALSTVQMEDTGCDTQEFDAYMKLRRLSVDRYMNLNQSIYELKDMPETARGLLGLVKFLGAAKTRGYVKAGSTMLQAAKAYLTYQFGIAPTASDVVKFVDQCSREKLRVLQVPLKFEKGEVVRAHWKIRAPDSALTQLCSFPPVAENTWSGWVGTNGTFGNLDSSYVSKPWAPSPNGLRKVRCYEYRGVVYGRLKTAYDISSLDRKLRAWTWSCPIAGTLWAVTPLSFLLDWFIDVGSVVERLDRYSQSVGNEPVFETGVWHSVRREVVVRQPSLFCRSLVNLVTSGIPPGGYPIWNYTCTNRAQVGGWFPADREIVYDRGVYIPSNSVWLPAFRWKLSSYQLSTGAALIVNLSKTVRGLVASL